jgi:hypothetical protein
MGLTKKNLGHISVAQVILKVGWSKNAEDQALHKTLRAQYTARLTAENADPKTDATLAYKLATANAYFDKLNEKDKETWLKLTGLHNERIRIEHERKSNSLVAAFSPPTNEAELLEYVTSILLSSCRSCHR